MARRSSISSSEKSFPGPGRPWAVIGAVALVVLVEVVLRLVPDAHLLGYGRGVATYHDIRHTIEQLGPADVSILGTSRGREAVDLPYLRARVADTTGQEITVASYTSPGSHADEMLQVARLLTGDPAPPRLVVYVVSPTMIQDPGVNWPQLDALGAYPARFAGRTGQFFTGIFDRWSFQWRQWLDHHYLTFRHRDRLTFLITSLVRRQAPTSAVQGDLTVWQRYEPELSLASRPVPAFRIQGMADRMLDADGRYHTDPREVQDLATTLALLRDHGVPVVLLDAPLSQPLREAMHPALIADYLDVVRGVARKWGLEVHDVADLGVALTDADFREQSHLNQQGARKVTAALVERFVVPALAGADRPRRR